MSDLRVSCLANHGKKVASTSPKILIKYLIDLITFMNDVDKVPLIATLSKNRNRIETLQWESE